jgi:predicted alpha-1,2-mannosidase
MKIHPHVPYSTFPLKPALLAVVTAMTLHTLSPSLQAYTLQTLTTNVLPTSGTDGGGDEFPGAEVPFGMVQWSPDTLNEECGGYSYSDSQIVGFGVDHMSGAGCSYGGNFAFTPILKTVTISPGTNSNNGKYAFPSTYSHTEEIATPGYYSVKFTNGIRTELTTTTRSGFGRFTYPASGTPGMVINACSSPAGTSDALIQINTNAQEISGWTIQNGFCGSGQNTTLYFDAVFDHPFATYGTWNGATLNAHGTNATGSEVGIYLTFSLPGGGVVMARTAISYVSVANARTNLQTESPVASFSSAGFDAMAGAASNVWNGYLNKIQVSGGTVADTATFYSMMYHALQAPSVVSDVNGQYIGFDGITHNVATNHAKYEFFSGWDIYRNECQFLAMMDPARGGDIAESLVLDAQQCGAMPRWSVPDGDTGVMMGDPATPIIADFYAFGATNFDTTSALAAMVRAAVNPATKAINGVHERDAERDYLNLGYVPTAESGGYGPVSMTLEYGSADAALARFAQSLGDVTNYTLAMNRAQNWRNHFNAGTGYLQPRDADGFWSPGFPAFDGQAYVEGSMYQYTWAVPFNLKSLIDLMGGSKAASARLDEFFTELNDADLVYAQHPYMGNEPCSETPWIYNYTGEPYKSSSVVRQIMSQLFSTAPGGFPGNDDLGQMASWYVLAALGMHPETPGDDVLVLNGPMFPQAVIHLTNGDVIITAAGAADDAPYVHSLSVNGQVSNAAWIRYASIANGGTLAFTVGTTANTNWGADPLLAPPSYMDGMSTPLAQNPVWGTGLETNDVPLTWTNTVDSAPYPTGGSENVGPIVSGVSGPELGARSENSESGNSEIMYSGKALGGATNYAYMKLFNLNGSNLTISSGMRFAYWIFPQSPTNDALATGTNSAYVALNLIFTDGTNLRDAGLTDQHGVPINPTNQASVLSLDTWNYVAVDLSSLAGKTISRIDLCYNQPHGSGGYRGYVDNLELSTPAAGLGANLALGQPASADSALSTAPASNANDSNPATDWSAADAGTNHWWQVDLGGVCNLTGDEVIWPVIGAVYDYTVAVSTDDTNWTTVVNKTANPSVAQDQSDVFTAAGRYVRIAITGLSAGNWAAIEEFRVFGTLFTQPSTPTGLRAVPGFGLLNVNWSSSANAASYYVARATSEGAETVIAETSSTNFVDTGLVDGTTYYYVVWATNSLGQSAASAEIAATPLVPAVGSYQAALLANHPLAYWPLSETNGQTAYDLVGGDNGTYLAGFQLARAGLTNGGFGSPNYAAEFDGSSGYVDIPEGPFNLTNAMTAVVWVKIPTTPTHFSGIVGHGDSSWRVTIDSSGHPSANDDSGSDASSPTSIVGTNWHMVAYAYSGVSGASGNSLLYVDGVLKATSTATVSTGDDLDVWIGGSPDYGNGRMLAGNIAQVSVFTNALSASQLMALYAVGTNTPHVLPITGTYATTIAAAHPLAYWPLNETNGSVAYDLVGGHDGLYVGGVTLGQAVGSFAGFVPQNNSALFDGSSGYVDIPEGPFNLTNALTAVAWVKVPSTPHFSGVIGHGNSSWRLTVDGSGHPGAANGSAPDATDASSIVGTNWHMMVYTCTGVPNASGNGQLYVDGVLTATNTVVSLTGNNLDLWIGGAPDYSTSRLLPGSIAQVAVFTNAFSATEVQALYEAASIAPPITLESSSATPAAGFVISWPQGTLLQATNPAGPWMTNTATSPCTVSPTNAQMYFRVRVE